ncbi:MAG: HEPN domain-containing protein [Ruminococcus flavefaciens]|nr:HEPN domain-containing protein [Ruminococcus flavefaciens]
MDDRRIELCKYRIQEAEDSLTVAKNCLKDNFYKDTINRSYYAVFYAVKAILSLGTVDFKRHKDVIAYFNKEYVATGTFAREIGRRLATLKQLREKSDYDDFYIASKDRAEEQVETASIVISAVKDYLIQYNIE